MDRLGLWTGSNFACCGKRWTAVADGSPFDRLLSPSANGKVLAVGTWTHAAAAIPSPGVDKFLDTLPIALSGNAQTFASGGVSLAVSPATLTMEVY